MLSSTISYIFYIRRIFMHIELSEHFTYSKLLRFTFPSIIMMALTSIYGVVDGFFISNFIGAEPFAAVNIVMPFLMIFGAVGFMIGTGGSALVPFILQNVFQSFLVTAEHPQLGLVTTLVSGVLNIVLDALFIAVFRWGVAGAASATALSQTIGGIVPLTFFIVSKSSKLRLGKTHMDLHAITKACTNGASEFMTNVSMSIVNMLYNWQLMRMLGTNGVAAYGVIMYVNFIFLSIYIGYSMGSAPIVGYHYGAGNKDELKNLFKKSLRIILVMSIVLTIAAEIFALILSIFFLMRNRKKYGYI